MSTYLAALQYVILIKKVFDDVKAVKGGKPIHEVVPLSCDGVQGDLTVAWVPRAPGLDSLPASL